MKRRTFVTVVASSGALSGCLGGAQETPSEPATEPEETATPAPSTPQVANNALRLVSIGRRDYPDSNEVEVSGTVRNRSEATVVEAAVVVTLYDDASEEAAAARAPVGELVPGEDASFEVRLSADPDVAVNRTITFEASWE